MNELSHKILARFPKVRPALRPEFDAIYRKILVANRLGQSVATSLSTKLESWMHRRVASDLSVRKQSCATLEIGAGTLNHLPYEVDVSRYDAVEPSQDFLGVATAKERLGKLYADIREVPLEPNYDRIISIATFEHVLDLPEIVARSCFLLRDEGTLRVAIPSEGGFLWWAGMTFSTGLEFRCRYGLSYAELMRHEHVNSAKEIEAVLRIFFDEVAVEYCGLSHQLSFYQALYCCKPKLELAREFLQKGCVSHG